MENEFSVKPVGVKFICYCCNEGEMMPKGGKSMVIKFT